MFGTISFTVNTFGQQQACTQRVSRGRGEVLILFLAQILEKKACLVCTLDRIFQVSQFKGKTSNLTLPRLLRFNALKLVTEVEVNSGGHLPCRKAAR